MYLQNKKMSNNVKCWHIIAYDPQTLALQVSRRNLKNMFDQSLSGESKQTGNVAKTFSRLEMYDVFPARAKSCTISKRSILCNLIPFQGLKEFVKMFCPSIT